MIHNGWCDLGSLQTYFIFASAPTIGTLWSEMCGATSFFSEPP